MFYQYFLRLKITRFIVSLRSLYPFFMNYPPPLKSPKFLTSVISSGRITIRSSPASKLLGERFRYLMLSLPTFMKSCYFELSDCMSLCKVSSKIPKIPHLFPP